MTTALIDLALGLALVVVVPLALTLDSPRPPRRTHRAAVVVAGVTASFSFTVAEGPAAAALASAWLVAVASLALRHLWPVRIRDTLADLPRVLPSLYLVVGGAWLVISRYGGRPLGFSDEIVELTAVHFHYAGFVAPLLLLRLIRRLRTDEGLVRTALAAVLAATPLTAAGITFSAPLGTLGALLFAGGLTTASWLTLRRVVPDTSRPAAVLLGVSSLSVIASMALAVLYALGQWLGAPAPSLPAMVRTHGALNALGFALAGTTGWVLDEKERGPEGPLS